MKVLLIGASGRTGRPVAQKLHAAAIPFRALIRNAAKADEFHRLGAETAIADLASDFSHAFEGIDAVVYAAGSAETEGADQERQIDRDAVIHAADYAKQRGVNRFLVISALLAFDPTRAPDALRHYAEMKQASDDYVIASTLDYVVLRPGQLSVEPGVGTIQIVSGVAGSHAPVAREDVAEVVIEALKAGLSHKVIGFAGGKDPIASALANV
ncbi:SDR family oxidoreductase [Paraburkholderia guartelaensis]|uniref:SDR family oxidoreductase n=1 Tax=Paraburkholderia guartelaensis TaxID=2546446 RepID=A0A4R5LKD8_9BURK|nr:SDR family oxidoreductase [Paraburkholderia guartelaensis]TDG10221.1 SDR family oxidoreductase [Paraburkholderia guartelaensis]